MISVRSPSSERSTAARRLRPIRRWISAVRPEGRPCETSRALRVIVARGSMAYSAVSQPLPLPARKPGTRFSTVAATSTRVSPAEMSTEPSANFSGSISIATGRSAFAARPSTRSGASRDFSVLKVQLLSGALSPGSCSRIADVDQLELDLRDRGNRPRCARSAARHR